MLQPPRSVPPMIRISGMIKPGPPLTMRQRGLTHRNTEAEPEALILTVIHNHPTAKAIFGSNHGRPSSLFRGRIRTSSRMASPPLPPYSQPARVLWASTAPVFFLVRNLCQAQGAPRPRLMRVTSSLAPPPSGGHRRISPCLHMGCPCILARNP